MDTTFNSKDLIKKLVKEQHFNSTADVMNCMKEMFADVLQETLNAEMDDHLGFDKSERRVYSSSKKNYRNGSTKRTLKTQLGEVEIHVPRDRNGEFESGIIGKYQRNADGLEERILSLYATGMSLNDIKN